MMLYLFPVKCISVRELSLRDNPDEALKGISLPPKN